ncbi:SRPBCC family protein [Nocardioides aequoreus]|uniref:SRPBCC family protein n=1 Tax=Nocardioides aequoreus TaxID=397278 RepID=UPI0004C2F6FE|nr:SRPBCC family protein [Nocardioides aequoreus]
MGSTWRGATTTLLYDVPPAVAAAYLADPVHRPEWQSSLRRVEVLDAGEPHAGQRWRDHTAVGLVAEMCTTAYEPGEVWAETGRWRGVSADLTLLLEPHGSGSRVTVTFAILGRGVLAPVLRLATYAALPAVRSDLARAGRLLSERQHR